ncbi:pseudouridine synthase [Salinimicrobium marinum]|uniref:Pseudouridine synthase n=2 Tax=Salinimicrobium marinum TaxID=680283 RepID=A0A918W0A2_9FLAO|nr:pseudouridine synthase [Salinimicrobium marinum]
MKNNISMSSENLTRLNKYLSEAGYCSRRKADELIDQGRVTINGTVPEMGTKVSPEDVVRVDDVVIDSRKKKNVYLAFNKPVGIVCTTNPEEKKNIVDYINFPTRIFPVGRLDKPSEGLIIMTDDGDIVNKILRARNNHEKEYIVTVNRLINTDFIERMGNGIPILDTVTKKCEVEQLSKYSFRIILTQGLNRQIRRMCEYLGYEVVKLKRIRIMNIKLDVPVGKYRDITPEELETLDKLTGDSTKTEEASLPPKEKKHSQTSSDRNQKFVENRKKRKPSSGNQRSGNRNRGSKS